MECILCVSGKIAVGKTSVSNAMASMLGAKRVTISDYLRSILKSTYSQNIERATLQELGGREISKGWDSFSEAIIGFADWDHTEVLIIDGVRHIELFETLKRTYKCVNLIYLTVQEDVRIKRIEFRGERVDGLIEKHASEGNIEALLNVADLVVDTSDASVEDTAAKILGLLQERGNFNAEQIGEGKLYL